MRKLRRIFVLAILIAGLFALDMGRKAEGFGIMTAATGSSGGTGCISGNDSYMKLLIHSNTTDGSTTFLDSASGSTTHVITAINAVHHETDAFKWGTTSIEYTAATSDNMSVPNHPDWNFGTGDFTLETWAQWKTDSTAYFISYDSSHVFYYNGGGKIGFYDAAAPLTNLLVDTGVTPITGGMRYVSAERSGNNLIVYFSGVSVASKDVTGKSFNWNDVTGGVLYVGGINFNGYLDEPTISKGIARHGGAANYDVPTGPYCD